MSEDARPAKRRFAEGSQENIRARSRLRHHGRRRSGSPTRRRSSARGLRFVRRVLAQVERDEQRRSTFAVVGFGGRARAPARARSAGLAPVASTPTAAPTVKSNAPASPTWRSSRTEAPRRGARGPSGARASGRRARPRATDVDVDGAVRRTRRPAAALPRDAPRLLVVRARTSGDARIATAPPSRHARAAEPSAPVVRPRALPRLNSRLVLSAAHLRARAARGARDRASAWS